MRRRISWMTVATVLAWAGAAVAATTGTPGIDVPINAIGTMVYNGLAVGVGAIGAVGVIGSIHGGHYGQAFGSAALGLSGGAFLHNLPTIAPYFGGAATATIQLAHHAIRLVA